MRILLKLVMKLVFLVIMVVVLGSGLRQGRHFIMKAAGMPGGAAPQFSSDEADLMSTVFQSAIRLFTGQASRKELSSELSDKLYAGRDTATMAELGIELVKPGGEPTAPAGGAGRANSQPGVNPQPGTKLPAKQRTPGAPSPLELPSIEVPTTALAQVWAKTKKYSVELTLIPVVFFGMVLVQRFRQRGRKTDFVPADLAIMLPADTEPYDMKHAVHALNAEDFELLVALVYQRQGYRISMPSALSGGRGGDFTLARKSERILVQCKKVSSDHRVPVERVRELHEAMAAAHVTRGMYVASCLFTWDAKNFAKTKGITLINARTLDELLTAAREKPGEDLLKVAAWVPKLMSKVVLTEPHCPACEAAMDEITVSASTVWVCTQRPDCKGRRSARKHQKPAPTSAKMTDLTADEVNA